MSIVQLPTPNQRNSSRSDCDHSRMQGVLATAPLSRFPYRVVLWNDLRYNPCHHFTVVQETEIIGVRYHGLRIVTGGNNHPNCRQQVGRTYRARGGVAGASSMANGFLRFKWTMRVIALIELFMLTIANLVRFIALGSADFH